MKNRTGLHYRGPTFLVFFLFFNFKQFRNKRTKISILYGVHEREINKVGTNQKGKAKFGGESYWIIPTKGDTKKYIEPGDNLRRKV